MILFLSVCLVCGDSLSRQSGVKQADPGDGLVVGVKIERGVLRRHVKLNGDTQTCPNVEALKVLFP
jgi:hypothetical protein